MNYRRVYNQIISNRKSNPLGLAEYGELHHIIPKCLGGEDIKTNLIRLTAREHFICHALLAEMYEYGTNEWYKMNHAFMMMKAISDTQKRYYNARLYELKKKDFSLVMSNSQSGNKNSQFGKIWIVNYDRKVSKKISANELQYYEDNGWVQGRSLKFDKVKKRTPMPEHYFATGVRINSNRRNFIIDNFRLDIWKSEDYSKLEKKLYTEYVEDNHSTTYLAKKYNITDPTIRKLLIDFGIGTKNRGGKW
tara:strand:- start:2387 stop:3133 length:747 start_codon:yes stop_codon:yes gene_type:complete